MSRPKLLDLFCGAGGAAVGYYRAGFDVVGVDIAPQRNFPFEFHRADALHYLAEHWDEFDAVHASCPCQRFSTMSACRPGLADEYPNLIAATRGLLELTGLPYVLENVPGSPLRPDLTLCGHMFGLPLYRHRVFESNVALEQFAHVAHTLPASRAGHWTPGTIMSVSGHVSPIAKAREAMGIDWMTRDELAEINPAPVHAMDRHRPPRPPRRGGRRMSMHRRDAIKNAAESPAPAESFTVEQIREAFKKHASPDEWGVPCFYEGGMIAALRGEYDEATS